MMPPTDRGHAMHLSSNHRRVLAVRFSRLEKQMNEVEGLLAAPSEEGVFSRCVNSISAEEKSQLSKLIRDAREELEAVSQVLCLDFSEQSSRGRVQSLLAFAWSDLEDTRPEKLAGYGQMSPEAASFLSPRVRRLIKLVRAMSSVLSPGEEE